MAYKSQIDSQETYLKGLLVAKLAVLIWLLTFFPPILNASPEARLGSYFSVGQENLIAIKPAFQFFPEETFPLYTIVGIGVLPPAPVLSASAGLGWSQKGALFEETFSAWALTSGDEKSQTANVYYGTSFNSKFGYEVPVLRNYVNGQLRDVSFFSVKVGYSVQVNSWFGIEQYRPKTNTVLDVITFEFGWTTSWDELQARSKERWAWLSSLWQHEEP